MLTIQIGNLVPTEIPSWQLYVIASLLIVVPLVFYVFRSIGLYVLAKRQNVEKAFLAWFPLLWIYVACKLLTGIKFFNRPIEKLAVIFCVIFSISEILTLVVQFFLYFPLVGNFLMGREICIAENKELLKPGFEKWITGVFVGSDFVNPYGDGIFIIAKIIDVISMFTSLLGIASLVITITIYINLFRKFWPQHYVLASCLCVFLPLFGPLVFAIRKKDPINYADYMRSRYPHGPYGNPYGPYNNPYGNPYQQGQNGNGTQPTQGNVPEEPFAEFGGRKEERNSQNFGGANTPNENPFEDF